MSETWRQDRDEAMDSVASHAEETHPNFAHEARSFVVDYLRLHGPTAGETITDACKVAGIRPHDDRAFGPVYMNLCQRGIIRKAGTAIRTKGHGTSGGNIWELTERSKL